MEIEIACATFFSLSKLIKPRCSLNTRNYKNARHKKIVNYIRLLFLFYAFTTSLIIRQVCFAVYIYAYNIEAHTRDDVI